MCVLFQYTTAFVFHCRPSHTITTTVTTILRGLLLAVDYTQPGTLAQHRRVGWLLVVDSNHRPHSFRAVCPFQLDDTSYVDREKKPRKPCPVSTCGETNRGTHVPRNQLGACKGYAIPNTIGQCRSWTDLSHVPGCDIPDGLTFARSIGWTHRAEPHDALHSCVTPTTLPGVDCTFFDWPFGSHEPNVSRHGIGYMTTVAVGLLKPPAMQWASLIILFGYRLEVSHWNMQPYPRQYENLPEYLTLLNSAHTLVGQKELWKIEKDQSLIANRWQYLFK